jgi:hypothetical protein
MGTISILEAGDDRFQFDQIDVDFGADAEVAGQVDSGLETAVSKINEFHTVSAFGAMAITGFITKYHF